jgi:hypothetical protein
VVRVTRHDAPQAQETKPKMENRDF